MRESIGGGLLFNLVITFVIIMIGVLVSSLAYSKAYKVKNKIIDMLEQNGTTEKSDQDIIAEIDTALRELGYNERNANCVPEKGGTILQSQGLDYCVEKITTNSGDFYYRVTTYMHLDIPIVGTVFSPAITGESKIIYNTYVNIQK